MRIEIQPLTEILTNIRYCLVVLLVTISLLSSALSNWHHLDFVLVGNDAVLTYFIAL